MATRKSATNASTCAITASPAGPRDSESLWILRWLCNSENWKLVRGVIPIEVWGEELQPLVESLDEYWTLHPKAREVVPGTLRVLVRQRTGDKAKRFLNVLERVLDQETGSGGLGDVIVERWIRREVSRRIALETLEQLERNGRGVDPNAILSRYRKIIQPFDRGERSFDYAHADTDYWKKLAVHRVATGFPTLDKTILGGLGAGELGVVIAPYKSGKTSFLINLGAEALINGLKVFHVSGELGKWQMLHRYDLRMSGASSDDLRKNRRLIQSTRTRVAEYGGRLDVRDASHERITPMKLERMIERLEELPDLIIVDYLGLMRTDRDMGGGGGDGRRAELGEVARELRRIASQFQRPVWTAAQANREASKLGNFSGTEIGEDISILQTCDVGICFICTQKMKGLGKGTLTVDGQRIGYGADHEIPLEVDFRRMLIREKERTDGDE